MARVLHTRVRKIRARHRPRYSPALRRAILEFKYRFRLSAEEIAWAFAVHRRTLTRWDKASDVRKGSKRHLLASAPVIKTADHAVASVVGSFRDMATAQSTKISGALHTLCRYVPLPIVRKRVTHEPKTKRARAERKVGDPICADYPNHYWMIDITVFSRFLKAVLPFELVVVLDAHARLPLAWRLFLKEPSAQDVLALIDEAIKSHGSPKHLVSDSGPQFTATAFKKGLKARGIDQRLGAIGQKGAIAIIERHFRGLKEMLHLLSDPTTIEYDLHRRIGAAILYCSRFRPHQSLKGATPYEIYFKLVPANHAAVPAPRGAKGDFSIKLPYRIVHALDHDTQKRLPYFARIE